MKSGRSLGGFNYICNVLIYLYLKLELKNKVLFKQLFAGKENMARKRGHDNKN